MTFFDENLYAPGQGTTTRGGALDGCPDIRPDGIYLDGHRVIRLGLQGVGVGGVSDLLAYRKLWDPFISAHYQLWTTLNERLESSVGAQKCPKGLFKPSDTQHLSVADQSFCAALRLSRMYVSREDPYGIWKRWNYWSGTSSADMLINAKLILEDLQNTVIAVGGPDKDNLVKIARLVDMPIELPDVPEFTVQQALYAQIEGAITAAEGVLEIIGYGAGETLKMAGSTTEAVAESIKETAKAVPEVVKKPITAIGIAAVVVVVGAGVLIYYMPRRRPERRAAA